MGSLATGAETQGLIANRYRIEAEIGKGGIAAVYRVVDLQKKQKIALKKLCFELDGETHKDIKTLFEQEFYTLTQLAHPRIVEVYDYGITYEHKRPLDSISSLNTKLNISGS